MTIEEKAYRVSDSWINGLIIKTMTKKLLASIVDLGF